MIPYINFDAPFQKIGLPIHMFGIMVAIGILTGSRLTQRRTRELGHSEYDTAQMITYTLVAGFIISHLFDVAVYQSVHRDIGWKDILNPFGGLSSFGGFMGALVGLFFWSRFELKVPYYDEDKKKWVIQFGVSKRKKRHMVMPYADGLGYGLATGWMFGRIGCFTAHDHPGHFTDFFLGINYGNRAPGGIRHDLGLYEAMWAALIAFAFFILSRKNRPIGLYVSILVIGYAPVRFALDFLRATDTSESDPRYFGLTPGHYSSLLTLAAGVGLAMWTWRNYKNPPAQEVEAAAPPDAKKKRR